MRNLTVTFELPRNLLSALDVPEAMIEETLLEMIALQLYANGRISTGKAAELLSISKLEFIRLLARHDIPYFTQTAEELADEVAAARELLGREDT
jgi:predicted HTH domain antitoxin